jgi:hypothetical protein
MSSHLPARRRLLRHGSAWVTGLLLLSACGSTSPAKPVAEGVPSSAAPAGSASTTTAAATATNAPSLENYQACLQRAGVDYPAAARTSEPTVAPVSPSDVRSFEKGRRECASARPQGALQPRTFRHETRSDFRRCMAEHGVRVATPTPTPGESESGDEQSHRGGMLTGLNRHDPTTARAIEACRAVLLSPTALTTPHPTPAEAPSAGPSQSATPVPSPSASPTPSASPASAEPSAAATASPTGTPTRDHRTEHRGGDRRPKGVS